MDVRSQQQTIRWIMISSGMVGADVRGIEYGQRPFARHRHRVLTPNAKRSAMPLSSSVRIDIDRFWTTVERSVTIGTAAARGGCTAEIPGRWDWGGPIFDTGMVDAVRDQATRLDYSHRDLPSQAGHDAYFLARTCPTAMIFTPCRGGITHNNDEDASRADLEPGLNVLRHSVVTRADRPA
jgi:hypothetical protein